MKDIYKHLERNIFSLKRRIYLYATTTTKSFGFFFQFCMLTFEWISIFHPIPRPSIETDNSLTYLMPYVCIYSHTNVMNDHKTFSHLVFDVTIRILLLVVSSGGFFSLSLFIPFDICVYMELCYGSFGFFYYYFLFFY